MKKQQGFTLVELVIVIVLLGILAATVAPRFMNMQGTAQASVMETTRASLKSASQMVYAKAVTAGEAGANGTVNIGVDASGNPISIAVVYGYPSRSAPSLTAIVDDLDTFETQPISGTRTRVFFPSEYTATTECRVEYSESVAQGAEPVIEVFTDEC